ncbi:glucose-1-phosphate cytidylyltransferase [Gammaproteobacteria bacterium]|nr:glucose-1-phosphate cytidylyltransferase [Gammaproteobacteria bacterium]
MKAVILAGGLGTRLAEKTSDKPKPMVEIGGMPIIWHIMKTFEYHGITDFLICCGYKGHQIKEFFASYNTRYSNVSFDLLSSGVTMLSAPKENWTVTCIDTGEKTMTGGRLKRVQDYLTPNEPFMFTYGDGVGDIDITELIKFHKSNNKLATVTAVSPPGRFGVLSIDKNTFNVTGFNEKPDSGNVWINGGYFVLEPEVLSYIEHDLESWEEAPIQKITAENQLSAFQHPGFWQPMDTLAEKKYLDELLQSNKAPWKKW